MFEMKMPQLGMGMTEIVVLEWLVQVGDAVVEGQHVANVETDKVDTELEAPSAGTILQILVPEGTTVPVGSPILVLGDPGEPVPQRTD